MPHIKQRNNALIPLLLLLILVFVTSCFEKINVLVPEESQIDADDTSPAEKI